MIRIRVCKSRHKIVAVIYLLLALLAYTDDRTVFDRARLLVTLLHLLEQGRPCDPLLALVACTDVGLVCECLGLQMSDENWRDLGARVSKLLHHFFV